MTAAPDTGRVSWDAHELGRRGEDLACRYLAGQGLTVLSRNWRCRGGELDVVATDGDRLVVCEVKTRASPHFGEPAEAVTPHQLARIRHATREWLTRYHVGWCPVRIDVIAVLWPPDAPPRVTHLTGVS